MRMVTQCNELRPTPFGSVAPQHRIRTSSRGIERECFKTWETFQETLLKFYAQKRGHDWNDGSITGTTSAGLQLRSMNRKRSWRAPASNCNRSYRAHSMYRRSAKASKERL